MSIQHWLVVGVLVLLLFGGRGKISELMGDVAKGVKSFKKGLAEEDAESKPADPKALDHQSSAQSATPASDHAQTRS